MRLPDIYVKKGTSGAEAFGNHMIHMEIIENNLIIQIDYDDGQFALWKAFELMGNDSHTALKKSKDVYDQEKAVADVEDAFLI